jgi:hypothetical protein
MRKMFYFTALFVLTAFAFPIAALAEAVDITADFTDPIFLAEVRSVLGKGPTDPILLRSDSF